jgi:hypothetical protein
MICDFAHGQVAYDANLLPSDWLVLGQNLAAVSNATVNLQFIIDQWYGEVQWYNYNTLSCQTNEICGHYTQVGDTSIAIIIKLELICVKCVCLCFNVDHNMLQVLL